MSIQTIEVAMDRYVQERMDQGRQRATEHFLAYAYLRHGSGEIREFMKKARGLSRYYVEFLKVTENPLKGPEMAFLATMIIVASFSCYLMVTEEKRLLGILLFAGTIVHFCSLLCMVAKKWRETGVMIAIYREIAELADNEIAGRI